MCGRYHFAILPNKLGKQIKERIRKLNLTYKEGEIFPTDNVLCIIPNDSKIDLATKKWGIKGKSLLINARVETINERVTFKNLKRCAVIADGFYEWDKEKRKYYISFKEEYMYFACIFNDDDELVILTKKAYGDFSRIHDRSPIVMNKEEMLKYIHRQNVSIKEKKLVINEEIKLL